MTQPVPDKAALTREVAAPTLAGVRSPLSGYPADGMNPIRLAQLLRAADQGDPLNYYELAEQIEERDPHYVGVLGTRKRSVSQIDVTVDAASDDSRDVAMADMIREWIARDELAEETFDILDAIGKGDSHTEILWDTSMGQWWPGKLEWRDPRWFRFDRRDGRTPLLRGGESGTGEDTPLPPFKFIRHTVRAKSGLSVRSGIARIAAWGWMFKAFTQRDWAIFTQTYGQPVRIGRFDTAASDSDKATLFRAVANIAGDCAAIVPKGMEIEFIESANLAAGADLYERRADWLDRQISKAVLGQTNTTDTQAGGLGSSQASVHNDVREDIETADCKALSATLNRDLVRPWIDLEFGPQAKYPRIRIARPKPEDLTRLANALGILVPLGLRVEASEIRDKYGLSDPEADAEVLMSRVVSPTLAQPVALQSVQQPAPVPSPADLIGDRLTADTAGDVEGWLDQLREMMGAATDLTELGEMVRAAYPALDTAPIAAKLETALVAANAAGRSDVEDEGADGA